jgi:hypothetical protein
VTLRTVVIPLLYSLFYLYKELASIVAWCGIDPIYNSQFLMHISLFPIYLYLSSLLIFSAPLHSPGWSEGVEKIDIRIEGKGDKTMI